MQLSIRYLVCLVAFTAVACGIVTSDATAATKPAATKPAPKPPATKPAGDGSKGVDQMAGGVGQFGVTYTLKSGFNYTVTGARYDAKRFIAGSTLYVDADTKMLILTVNIKNATTSDNWFPPDGHTWTAVDSTDTDIAGGGNYHDPKFPAHYDSLTLKPGQGVTLEYGMTVPAKGGLKKLILNQGKMGTSEDIIRFPIDGKTNVIAPVPDFARDPADTTGATALPAITASIGTYYPTNIFDIRVDKVSFSDGPINGNPPDDGKRFVVVLATAKSMIPDVQNGMFPLTQPGVVITDADSESHNSGDFPIFKATKDEEANPTLNEGQEYQFRYVVQVPKDTALKTMSISENSGRPLVYDISSIK